MLFGLPEPNEVVSDPLPDAVNEIDPVPPPAQPTP